MNRQCARSKCFHVAAQILGTLFLVTVALACISMAFHPGHVDFLSYWAAGRLVLQGHPAAAYDLAAHHAVETTVVTRLGLIPFPYPPAFLFAVTPFALFPLSIAFSLWLLLTIVAYLVGVRRFAGWPEALAHPSVITNGLIGQNGFLSSAILGGGMTLLRSSPLAGGALLGLMSYKPQLALLVPVALIAGREWKALAAAAISSSCLWLCALIVFGPEAYVGFLSMLPRYAEFVGGSKWSWGELASPFAFVRFCGGSQGVALVIQVVVGCAAVATVCLLWWHRADGCAAALATGALLIPPYIFTYDALLLAIAFGWLFERGSYVEALIAWLLCLPPVVGSFGLYSGPNTVPLAAILCLASIVRISSPREALGAGGRERSQAQAMKRPPTPLRPSTR